MATIPWIGAATRCEAAELEMPMMTMASGCGSAVSVVAALPRLPHCRASVAVFVVRTLLGQSKFDTERRQHGVAATVAMGRRAQGGPHRTADIVGRLDLVHVQHWPVRRLVQVPASFAPTFLRLGFDVFESRSPDGRLPLGQ